MEPIAGAGRPVVKLCAFAVVSIASFYLGKRWAGSEGNGRLLFFNRQAPLPYVRISPNFNKTFDVAAIINSSNQQNSTNRSGIVDESGATRDELFGGQFIPDVAARSAEDNRTKPPHVNSVVTVKHRKFPICSEKMRDYIPCLDNIEAIQKLRSVKRGEEYERHCPEPGRELDCLIPAPTGYKIPIPWPQSRDEIWFNNVPHTRLVEDKGGQNWISIDGDKFKFPGGGTQFIHGADQYLDQISQMVPELKFGSQTRVVLDVGCGVASFGAFLLSQDVVTLSVAPKDVHENQIQFALERGVPAMVAVFATHRLLYPSQAFDLIHCSRCRINWTQDDGILLLEVNRMLRAGGYFAWAAQPVYKHEEAQQEAWREMETFTRLICWEIIKKQGYIAIWKKPLNNSCYFSREPGSKPPLCGPADDPDNLWYVDLDPCITRLPENGFGVNVVTWPKRLHYPPDRLQLVDMDAFVAKKELFRAEANFWIDIVSTYVRSYKWKELRLRNVMDMRAGFGGYCFFTSLLQH